MNYRVEIARKAALEIRHQHDWLVKEHSLAMANHWRDPLLVAIDELAQDPSRYPEAMEAEWYGEGLRELLHGTRFGEIWS